MPARKAPSAIETPNTAADPTASPIASASTVSVNSSRDRVAAMRSRITGITRRPTIAATATRPATLSSVSADARRERAPTVSSNLSAGSSTRTTTVSTSWTTSQPTAMCPAGVCSWRLSDSTRTSTTVLATESDRPKTMAAGHVQPKAVRGDRAERRSRPRFARSRPGMAIAPDGQQLVEVELQPDAEHQQDDADFRELFGDLRVGDEAGRVGPDDDAGQQIADDGRQAEALRDVAEEQRRAEAAGERQDEAGFLHRI